MFLFGEVKRKYHNKHMYIAIYAFDTLPGNTTSLSLSDVRTSPSTDNFQHDPISEGTAQA
jgi:hypothetical protein